MNKMLDAKEIILTNIDVIFQEYNNIKEDENVSILKLIGEVDELRECNRKLITEVCEKDKLLIVNEKKMIDYEHMINQIQEEAMKVKTEKERFDMLKKQDREIHERDIEIKRLQRKVSVLEEKFTLLNKKSDVDDNVVEVKADIVTLDIEKGNAKKKKKKEVETKVVDEVETKVVDEVETKVVDEVETKVVDEVETKVEDEVETDELSEEEDMEVEVITYYKKEFYVIVNESPQYIYTIEDGDLGEKVGEVKGGKKVFYKSSKK